MAVIFVSGPVAKNFLLKQNLQPLFLGENSIKVAMLNYLLCFGQNFISPWVVIEVSGVLYCEENQTDHIIGCVALSITVIL